VVRFRADLSASISSLRRFFVPHTRLSAIGDRAFPVAAARLWMEHSAAERHVGIVKYLFSGNI